MSQRPVRHVKRKIENKPVHVIQIFIFSRNRLLAQGKKIMRINEFPVDLALAKKDPEQNKRLRNLKRSATDRNGTKPEYAA